MRKTRRLGVLLLVGVAIGCSLVGCKKEEQRSVANTEEYVVEDETTEVEQETTESQEINNGESTLTNNVGREAVFNVMVEENGQKVFKLLAGLHQVYAIPIPTDAVFTEPTMENACTCSYTQGEQTVTISLIKVSEENNSADTTEEGDEPVTHLDMAKTNTTLYMAEKLVSIISVDDSGEVTNVPEIVEWQPLDIQGRESFYSAITYSNGKIDYIVDVPDLLGTYMEVKIVNTTMDLTQVQELVNTIQFETD